MRKKVISLIMALAMLLLIIPMGTISVSAETVYYDVTGGQLKFDTATGTITGYAGQPTDVVIPEEIGGIKVQIIGYRAFNNCSSLTSFLMQNGVIRIRDYAFCYCINLKEINFPDSLISIGTSAFDNCWGLINISIPNSVMTIGNSSFSYCTNLNSVVIGTGIANPFGTTIGYYSFYQCENLENVIIGDDVISIENFVFQGCEKLNIVTIGNRVKTIGDVNFNDSLVLKEINVNSDNKYYSSVDGILFNKDKTILIKYPIGKSYKTYSIPNSVTSIGIYAFERSTILTKIVLPNIVKDVGSLAFADCTELVTIVMPNGLINIGTSAFKNCGKLISVTIPSSVTNIGNSAFYTCSSLTSIKIPISVTYIGDYAFQYCRNLTIYGEKGSYAETYANNNSIPFKQISNDDSNLIIIPSTSLILNTTQHIFNGIGKELYLVATLLPANTSNQSLKITSSNPNVAISKGSVFIADKQVITIVSKGFGNCTIKVENEGNTATCNITVSRSLVSEDEQLLRKIALSNIVYNDEVLNSIGKRVKNIKTSNDNLIMFKVGSEEVKWRTFWDKYIGDYKVLEKDSTKTDMQAVAFEDENGDIVIAYRGTEDFSKNPKDFIEGIKYTLLNLMSNQYNEAFDFYQTIKNNKIYENKNISLTGHSLGGALASYISILDDSVKADVFNDATDWILSNTYINNWLNIKSFKGINATQHTSYINITNDGFNNFVARTYPLYSMYEMLTNGYNNNEGAIHGLPAMLKYNNETREFSLFKNILGGEWQFVKAQVPLQLAEVIDGKKGILGTNTDDFISMSSQQSKAQIYCGNGNDKIIGTQKNDYIIAVGSGEKALFGLGGSDTYVVDKNINNSKIFISDTSGRDTLIIKNTNSTENFNILDNGNNYYFDLNNNCRIFVNKNRDFLNAPLSIELRDSNGILLRTMKFEPLKMFSMMSVKYMLSNSQYTLKSIKLMGDIEVSVFNENNILLGTHNNLQSEIITTPYGYFYPSFENGENVMLIDLINGNYTLKITSNSFVGCEIYDPQAQGSVWYGKKDIDLSDGSKLVINTDFINAQNKFTIEENSVIEPITARELAYASSVNINQSSINIKAGEKQTISATVLPDNSLGFEVSWEVIQPNENSTVATVINDGRITNVIGITEGTAILRATAMDDCKAFAEISITVTQSAPPKIYSDTYIEASYTDAESVRVFATAPLGFDKLFINGTQQSYIDITAEGQNKVYAYAMNSQTGEITKTAIYNVNIDRQNPIINGVENGGNYYFDRFVSAYDVNLKSVTVNNIEWTTEELKGEKIFSEVGNYTVVAQDFSGRTATVSFEILPIPDVSDISSDSVKLVNLIRDEFEQVKYDLPQNKIETLENQISVIENQWITQTGIWNISLEKINDTTINVKVINRLNDYSNPPLLLVSFYKDSKFLFIKQKGIENDVNDYTFEIQALSEANSVKAFLWENINSLEPVCNSTEIIIN